MNRAQRRIQHRRAHPDLFADALERHRAGHFAAAERGYRQVLTADPCHADSLHLLGVLALQRGAHADAVGLIRRAIAIAGEVPLYHGNLGTALQALGRLDEAVACFRRALALRPEAAEMHYNLGNALQAQGALEAAAESFRVALTLRPGFAAAHYNLGNVVRDLGRLEEAAACYRAALAEQPDLAPAHANLGRVLARLGRLEDALVCAEAALRLEPDDPRAHDRLGTALADLGRLEEARASLRTAVRLRPDDAESHFNLATVLLAQGDLAAGWEEYEWRWRTPQLAASRRAFAQRLWSGTPAEGARLLIHAEQGFGDTLQFCRYAPMAAARGLRVILEVQPALVRLLRTLPDVEHVVAQGETLPAFDLQCPMLSLPRALGTTLATIPADSPYLRADAAQTATWRTRLAAGSRVGLAWAGSGALLADRCRSFDPALLAPLLAIPGLRFFSLQKDGPSAPAGWPLVDAMAEMSDFADTAALVANLDLVIAADTAVAHLAAALGRPVWLLNRFDTCWRWLVERRDSPWYPSLRLYRQPQPGAWDAVISEVAEDLQEWGRRPQTGLL